MNAADQYLIDRDLHRIRNSHTMGPSSKAVLFIHGFTGQGIETWGEFPNRFRNHADLVGFDFFFWKYPSKLNFNPIQIVREGVVGSGDPGIELIGQSMSTVLETHFQDYARLMLVAHSMGGLVVQSFVINEIKHNASQHLDRIVEIVLYATPSGGLASARRVGFFKRQIQDMANEGHFIRNLRAEWQQHVESRRADENKPSHFRLTLVAGQRDRFVPEESSLEPFPLDEHEVVLGNHIQLVKPEKSGDRTLEILKKRLLRGTPTAEELRSLNGESREAVETIAKIQSAAELADLSALRQIAAEFVQKPTQLPTVERTLALALAGQRDHGQAVQLFERYLEFQLTDGSRPFLQDAYVNQQLAISLSALGRNLEANQTLDRLPKDIRADSETMGIRAGRMKREWLENRSNLTAARKAFQTYRAAFVNAKEQCNTHQALYSGINMAFMSFMLDLPHEQLCEELIQLSTSNPAPDYWTFATLAEALLLLQRFEEAAEQYTRTFVEADTPRSLATTAAQAITIIEKLGNPADTAQLRQLIDDTYDSLSNAIDEQNILTEEAELAA